MDTTSQDVGSRKRIIKTRRWADFEEGDKSDDDVDVEGWDRRSDDEVFDVRAKGRKGSVQSTHKTRALGLFSVCERCRKTHKRCDRHDPCSECMLAGLTVCERATDSAALSSSTAPSPPVVVIAASVSVPVLLLL